ncbi:hypothetical protein BayCH28_05805 [Mycolicibacterium sp. CH28]|uniref:hypothetical protein n=1 Tax=Mycolicibacterium sp. CH28 TaxID=2512237 RepID=UPI001080A0C2|nr:hypothetical protein [Mycolicibacterium sp. CH28]TGD88908.1 hypothetical protein BayCH28_05805 [Mycolicibacterium sp. CH28]
MRIAVRSSIASGVALVGAGAIALAPIQPVPSPLSNAHLPAVFSGTGVSLTATFDPITPWVDLVTATVSNAAAIGEDWLADPLPALRQMGTNWFGYTDTTITALGGVASATYGYLTTTLPQALTTAFQQVADGDLSGAAGTINTAIGTAVLTIGLPLFPVLDIPVKIADNLAAVVTAVTGLGTVFPALIGVLAPVEGSIQSFGDSAQAVLNAISAGDAVTALNAAVNTLPTVIGAAINGYTATDGSFYPGLLSPPDANGNNAGIAYTLTVTIPKAIATALGATPPVTALKQAAPSAEAVVTEEVTAPAKTTGTAQPRLAATSADSAAAVESGSDATEPTSGGSTAVKDGNKFEPGTVGGSGATGARGAGASKSAASDAGTAKDSTGGGAGTGRSARHAAGSDK